VTLEEREDDRGQDSGDAIICVDVRMSDVELAAHARRASYGPHQSTVSYGEQRQRHEDTENKVQPDVGTHQTSIERLQRPRTLDEDRQRPVRTRNGLDNTSTA